MKIYNKKSFALGIFITLLAAVNLIGDLVNKTMAVNGVLLVCSLFLFGFVEIVHSLSQKFTKQEKLEHLDERNQLIALKSKSKAFSLSQAICFGLMLALLTVGKVSGYESLITIAIGLAFTFPITMLTELFTYMYYEDKN